MSPFTIDTSQYFYDQFSVDNTIHSNNIFNWAPECSFTSSPFCNVEPDSLARVASDCSSVASGSTLSNRKSKKTRRQKHPSWIPRPRNSFFVFRSAFIEARKLEADGTPQNELSKEAGIAWKAMDNNAKYYYQEMARVEKEMHRMQYPDYQYAPQGSGKPRKVRAKRSAEHAPSPASLSPSPEAEEPLYMFENAYHVGLETETSSFYYDLPQSLQYGSDTYMSSDYKEETCTADEEDSCFIDWGSFMLSSEFADVCEASNWQ